MVISLKSHLSKQHIRDLLQKINLNHLFRCNNMLIFLIHIYRCSLLSLWKTTSTLLILQGPKSRSSQVSHLVNEFRDCVMSLSVLFNSLAAHLQIRNPPAHIWETLCLNGEIPNKNSNNEEKTFFLPINLKTVELCSFCKVDKIFKYLTYHW